MDSAKLLTLACIAYRERQFGDAGRLFAASLDAEDSDSLLETLCASMDIDYDAIQEEVDTMISEANSFPSLSEIASALEEGMKEEYVSVGRSEDEEFSEVSDSEAESSETESSSEETVTDESGSESGDQPEQQSASEAGSETDSSEVAEDEIETTSSEEESIEVSSCIKRK